MVVCGAVYGEVVWQTFTSRVEENMDMLSGRIGNEARDPLRKVVFMIEEVRSVLGAIMGGVKQPRPNKVKGELCKSMIGSDELVRRLTQA